MADDPFVRQSQSSLDSLPHVALEVPIGPPVVTLQVPNSELEQDTLFSIGGGRVMAGEVTETYPKGIVIPNADAFSFTLTPKFFCGSMAEGSRSNRSQTSSQSHSLSDLPKCLITTSSINSSRSC